MHVLWLSHLVPYPPKGGVQQRSYNLIRELAKYHEVTLLAFNQVAHIADAAALAEAVRHFSQFCAVEPVLSLPGDVAFMGKQRLALRSLFGSLPYTVRWVKSDEYERVLRACISRRAPDAMHFDTISLALYRPIAAHIPAALNHHNIESDMLLRRAELEKNPAARFYYWQEGRRVRAYERRVATGFAAHLTCSALDAERLQAVAGAALRTEVIPNGVDLDYFKPTGQHAVEQNSLIFAGRLSWYPNAAAMKFMVREVWPLLKGRCAAVTLTIVGKSPAQELIAAAATDPQLRVTGFVDDVRPYLEKAQVYVCPIFDGGGTKLKILDALAMGCAIVAHPVSCEGIDVTPGKDVIFASTPQEIAEAVLRVFSDPRLRQSLCTNALALARSKYSFENIGRKLAGVYDSLASASG